MPKGIGTYGSKVGRPSKKRKYQVGGEVQPTPGPASPAGGPNFPMENEAIKDANKMGQELKEIPLEATEPEFPISDAMERSENYQLGGMVKPPTSPSISSYKKGGKVDVTDITEKIDKMVARDKRYDKRIAKADKAKETIKSGAEVYPLSDKLKYEKKGHRRLAEAQIKTMKKKVLKKKRRK
jgi:hypothetical protein